MNGDQGQIKAKREAAARARRLVWQFNTEADRERVARFAADHEAQADTLERAMATPPPAPQVTQVQVQMQQAPPREPTRVGGAVAPDGPASPLPIRRRYTIVQPA